jgi:hypothetical protein
LVEANAVSRRKARSTCLEGAHGELGTTMSQVARARFMRALPVWMQPLGVFVLGTLSGRPIFAGKMAWKVFLWQWGPR